MAKPQPGSPIEQFNQRYSGIRQRRSDHPTVDNDAPDDETPEKDDQKKKKKKKKRNSTNDLSQLGSLIQENEEEQNRKQGEDTMADTFTPTEIQKKACGYLGIDYKDFADEKSLLEKLSNSGVIIQDDKILVSSDKVNKNTMDDSFEVISPEEFEKIKTTEAEETKGRDDDSDHSDLTPKDDELHIHEGDTPPIVHEPTATLDWIDEKVKDYEAMKAAGNTAIKTITPDKTARTFTAEVDNGTVTYTDKNDVTITKDSSYKVFDTVMKEASNAGKAVRIPEDATPEFKTNLFIAAVLNGHKVNGAEGLELDSATMEKIGLTTEQKAAVLAALPKKGPEKTPEEKTPEEKTPEVSKEVKEAIAKLEESKVKLAEMVKDGKVVATITTNPDTKKSEISFSHDPAKGGIKEDATEANKLLSEALKSVGILRKNDIPEDKKAAEQVILDNYAIKSAQLDLIRSVYQPEQSEAVKAMDRIRAKKLGLTDDPVYKYARDKDGHLIRNRKGDLVEDKYQIDKEGHFVKDEKGRRIEDESKQVKALEGAEREAYQSKLSASVLARIKAGHESK